MRRLLLCLALSALVVTSYAGRCGGPAQHCDVVRAGYIDIYRESFDAGKPAVVTAVGDGDIDILIYDRDLRLVASDVAADGTPACAWTPEYTGKFTIRVRNCEIRPVHYMLRTN